MKNIEKYAADIAKQVEKATTPSDKDKLLTAMDKLMKIQTAENAHEQDMARILMMLPPKKTMATVMDKLLNWLIYDLYDKSDCEFENMM